MSRFAPDATNNGAKIRNILENRAGSALLYRTCRAGPSGQRRDLLIARIAYTWRDPFEIRIVAADGPYRSETYGWAARAFHQRQRVWAIYSDSDFDISWLGYASSLSIGCDVLISGGHAALGNHDAARIGSGSFCWNPHAERY